VSLTIQKYLLVLDAREAGWTEGFEEALASGSNFFLIVPNKPDLLAETAKIRQVTVDELPKSCDRKNLFSLIAFIDPNDFDRMLVAQEEGSLTCYIEQIDLPRTRPPYVKPFLVYCSVRGIVSQHDNPRDAREACSAYTASMSGLKNQHEATVYKWRGNDWYNTETC
jgi:hypothetical protein